MTDETDYLLSTCKNRMRLINSINQLNNTTMQDEEMYFDEWFDMFADKSRAMGYQGPIDRDSANSEFEQGKTPEEAAQEFVKEMSED